MIDLLLFAWVMYVIQILQSVEELSTGFHYKWFIFTMSFRQFLIFEVCFNFFWLFVLGLSTFPYREFLLASFILLLFGQSLWHLAWWATKRHYVPGLITAWIHVVLFILFYFQIVLYS